MLKAVSNPIKNNGSLKSTVRGILFSYHGYQVKPHYISADLKFHKIQKQSFSEIRLKLIGYRLYSTKANRDDEEHSKTGETDGDQKDTTNVHHDLEIQRLQNIIKEKAKEAQSPYITKAQLLAKASGFLERLKIRSKWALIKSVRPFNMDDFSAFFSWIVMGNALLIFLATTTFFSLVILTMNTVFAQEKVAEFLGNLITRNSSLTVTFENAIVPSWKDSKISFRKCFVSMRPKNTKKFIKGSQAEAAANAANTSNQVLTADDDGYDDGNYTQFDITLEEVNVSLSFNKWFNGKGILKDVEVKGVRGIVDRTHVFWEEGDDATNYKNVHKPGDFEIENFKMEDVLFTLAQPNGFRPFQVSVYNCELPQLRKHWLFYDFLNATSMSGSYDNSLFTIHKKQRFDDFHSSNLEDDSIWKRITRLRIDSLNVDHLNTGLEGPFGWITSGKVDMIGDIMVPGEGDGFNMTEIVSIITTSIAKEAKRYTHMFPNQHHLENDVSESTIKRDISKYFVLDLQIRLNNVRAMVPLFTPDLSYVNYALIRPIVGYINSKNTYIEISCQIVKKLSDFDGSWTIYDCLLMDDISAEVYDGFVDYVADEEARTARLKKVGFWSLQLFLQLLVISLGTVT